MVTRIMVALLLAGVIGFEREIKRHFAGFRTHILVGVGACLMMLLSIYGFESFIEHYDNIRFDPARIPSYVISGIGFLGAGTIIVYGGTIRGLTTAASIWAVAGIGLVVGAGMYAIAVFTTIIILISLIFLNNIENVIERKVGKVPLVTDFEIITYPDFIISDLLAVFENRNLEVRYINITKDEDNNKNIHIKVDGVSESERKKLFDEIAKLEDVKIVSDVIY
jgi:putative Mg2+ transporter-C (MgtC) family protein